MISISLLGWQLNGHPNKSFWSKPIKIKRAAWRTAKTHAWAAVQLPPKKNNHDLHRTIPALLEERELLSPRAVASLRPRSLKPTSRSRPIDRPAADQARPSDFRPGKAIVGVGRRNKTVAAAGVEARSRQARAKNVRIRAWLRSDRGRSKPQAGKKGAKTQPKQPVEKTVAKAEEKRSVKPAEKRPAKPEERWSEKPAEKPAKSKPSAPAAKPFVEKSSPKQPAGPAGSFAAGCPACRKTTQGRRAVGR